MKINSKTVARPGAVNPDGSSRPRLASMEIVAGNAHVETRQKTTLP